MLLFPLSLTGLKSLREAPHIHNSSLPSDTVTLVASEEAESNSSTGYSWYVEENASSNVKVLGSRYVHIHKGVYGAPGKQNFYVVGASAGVSELTINYKKYHEPVIEESLTFSFNSKGKFIGTFTLPPRDEVVLKGPTDWGDPGSQLPDDFNWCDQGSACTPVKNQGNCGSCWAFATIGPFEQLIAAKDGDVVDLSEQYLVSCSSSGTCSGGYNGAFADLVDYGGDGGEAGAPWETDFQYQAADVPCGGPYDKAYRGDDWGTVGSTSTESIKQAIYNHGPIWAGCCADTMQGYDGGIFAFEFRVQFI